MKKYKNNQNQNQNNQNNQNQNQNQNNQNTQKNLPVYIGWIKGYKKFIGTIAIWGDENKMSGKIRLFRRNYRVYIKRNQI
ncbi:MAG: hypothetical protein RMJ67_06335 [Elusimicrobiota bacterium]|nr:hypothetical protein [Endomicrobiia bacterium]MDW8166111.1 hypothetical protein [Elusimicrobiota bacterium]